MLLVFGTFWRVLPKYDCEAADSDQEGERVHRDDGYRPAQFFPHCLLRQ